MKIFNEDFSSKEVTLKKNSIEYEFAEYLYNEYATHRDGVYFDEDYTFEDAKEYYYDRITKRQYQTAINWLKELDLPVYDGYLELSQDYTFHRLNTEKSEDEIYAILDYKFEEFEQESGVEIFALGRSGRHICIENTFENVVRYKELKNLQEKLENEFIEEVNNDNSFDDIE